MISFIKYIKTTIHLNKGLSGVSLFNHWKVFSEWKIQLRSQKKPIDLELPWISVIAKNYIQKYLDERSKEQTRIFEYGSGGSSLYFLKNASKVVSVEHDQEWFNRVKSIIAEKRIQGWDGYFLNPEFIDESLQKEIRQPGNPDDYFTDDESFSDFSFKNYASSIDKFEDGYFDIVLVDGRSRPACIKHSVNKIKYGGLLVLDNAEREYYLQNNYLEAAKFQLVQSVNSVVICSRSFSKTNIYLKNYLT